MSDQLEKVFAVSAPVAIDITNDPGRLLRARDAMVFLGMTRPTFYRAIKKGIVPKQRYMGTTPYWRLGELRTVYDNFSDAPVAEALSPSK